LKLEKGKVFANKDFGAAVEEIDTFRVSQFVNVLEIANKSFLYGYV
jgi:hypothetical protein